MDFEVTKIGERGQVVIPQSFRDRLGINTGDKFMVLRRGDMLVLKPLKAPSSDEFESMLKKAEAHTKSHGIKQEDVNEAIRRVRAK
ncbi:MAG TPA: AbrB/MazE/SpoVT family DNA-binding domain-containing protein [Candidatus Nanoarchaeia archaeon]|nr:AbrB/MazE/SpoVT family DNA-binding domain-containing protein [Candidatus Nanoarchaeia archaeon]